jgi:hypothetical protein
MSTMLIPTSFTDLHETCYERRPIAFQLSTLHVNYLQ